MVRLAPVVIGKDLANPTAAAAGIDVRGDVLMVMAGTSGGSEAALRMLPPTGTLDATNLRLPSGLGYSTSDLILITNVATNQSRNCLVQQVGTRTASDATQSLPLAGTYYTATGLSDYGVDSLVTKIGNAAGNMPLFNLYGVGENRTLFSYDLLQPAASAPEVAVAEGVVEMRAIYLTDPDNDGSPLVWVDPGANALFAADTLVNGSTTSQDRLRSIVAVRVGLIMRTSLEERAADYQPPTRQIILFGDTTVPQQRDLDATGEINYRFRTVDVTIPIRNVALSPLP
jgi:type IV pilus assembly protein PilW